MFEIREVVLIFIYFLMIAAINGQSQCEEDEWQCNNGKCISSENVCDGKFQCFDESDETLETCYDFDCPTFAFRCSYGGCISGNAKCDGVKDCVDNSDENKQLCDEENENESNINLKNTTEGCKIQEIGNLIFLSNDEILPYEHIVPNGGKITNKCPEGYILDGHDTNLCFSNKWFNKQPTCTKPCDNSVLKGITFDAKCGYSGTEISCNDTLRPGTQAKLSCKHGYHYPDAFGDKALVCNETTSEWETKPSLCTPECGIVNGNINSVPWHVGIYERSNKTGLFANICGGTILTEKVVISAAHCFWDDSRNGRKIKQYKIGVGKLYRNYYADEPSEYFDIDEIAIHPGFSGSNTAYTNNIAIIILNGYVIFNSNIKPICIEFDATNVQLPENKFGQVASWGNTENDGPYGDLRSVKLPISNTEKCRKSVQPQYQTFITDDRFCIKNVEGENVCESDTGSGLVLQKMIDGIKTYFLRGVVSSRLDNKLQCEGNYYTTITNIQFYEQFIKPYYLKYRLV